MLRIIGLMLVAASGVGAGAYAASILSRRAAALEAAVRLVDIITGEIRYSAPPLEDIVRGLSRNPELSRLSFLEEAARLMSRGENPTTALEKSVNACNCRLREQDKQLIINFSRGLGKSDVEGQLAHCGAFRGLMGERAALARGDAAGKSKLYVTLGAAGGAALALLML